jgi:hypothetical protein
MGKTVLGIRKNKVLPNFRTFGLSDGIELEIKREYKRIDR